MLTLSVVSLSKIKVKYKTMKTAICVIIKNEQKFLKEWIEWHLNLGFDAIHIFEDKDSISHEYICDEYSNVFLRGYENDMQIHDMFNINSSVKQYRLYTWFAEEYKNIYDWIAFIDLDEFIIFSNDYNLDKFCKEFDSYPAVHLSWKMKGASGHIKSPTCNVMDAYTSDANFPPEETGWRVKSFINSKHFKGMTSLHHSVEGVDVNGKISKDHLIYEKCWINHYFTKSWEDWCDRIFNRGGIQPGHRTLSQFFECNPDMEHLREELIYAEADRMPNESYWLDKKRKLIAGGNIKKILQLNRHEK